MTKEDSARLYELISDSLGGALKASFLMVVFESSDLSHPAIITDIPEEYIKRLMRRIASDMDMPDKVRVRCGDAVAFHTEQSPEGNQQN